MTAILRTAVQRVQGIARNSVSALRTAGALPSTEHVPLAWPQAATGDGTTDASRAEGARFEAARASQRPRYATHAGSGDAREERLAHSVLYTLQTCGRTGAALAAHLAHFGPAYFAVAGEAAKALISPRVEQALGREVAARFLIGGRHQVSNDPALRARLDDVATRVVSGSARRDTGYEFRLLTGDDIQAAACPGGIVLVNEGTLRGLESDDALGFVLGHEVGHVERRDTLDAMQYLTLRAQMQRLAVLESGDAREGAVIGTLLDSYYNRYVSQPAELQADRHGIEIAHAVGYDAAQSIAVLHTLEAQAARAGRPTDGPQPRDVVGRVPAHPCHSVRVAAARDVVSALSRGRAQTSEAADSPDQG